MRKRNIIGSGIPPGVAQALAGTIANDLTAAGTAQSDALAIRADHNIVTTAASGAGVRLPSDMEPGDTIEVVNQGANPLAVYPPSGGQINGHTANLPATQAVKSAIVYRCVDGTDFSALLPN